MSTPVALLLAAVLIAGNGFFVAVEFALLAARQTKLTGLAETSRRAPSCCSPRRCWASSACSARRSSR
jgi:CBS domain containing-hemolysin-like protein